MKALLVVTGRGLGGDAAIALNVIKVLEKRGVQCDIALDESAHGSLFEKNGYSWHKISIPQAGGHSATKFSTIKGALRMIPAVFKCGRLIKKVDVDFVIGVLGGGAVVASAGSKLARKPCFSLISTPLDSKVCPKLNQSYIFPELDKFRWETLPANADRSFYPLSQNAGVGEPQIALENLKKFPNFDENKKTIVFSSGSSIFKGMIDGINKVSETTDEYNLVLLGLPLHDEYQELIDEDKIIYAGYIDWINSLFNFADLAVLTDDGVSLEESLVCGTPIVALTKVKWGRYQNMAGVFKGAIVESEVSDVYQSIRTAFDNYDSLKQNALKYGKMCSEAGDVLVDKILKEVK